MGCSTDIQAPDFETRVAILRTKAVAEELNIPPDVIQYVAHRVATNIRELEGALIRVTSFASLSQQPLDLHLTEIVLRDFIPGDETKITVDVIIAQAAAYFGVSEDEIKSHSRSRQLVNARQIAMYLCRELTDQSLPKIGQKFHRDHSTIMHACNKIRDLMAEKHTTYHQVTELTTRIKRQPVS
jgi:chromosomal replication initiator protein